MELFLSGLILNPESREANRDLREPYEMHRTLMLGFDGRPTDQRGRILWRRDGLENGQTRIIIQSECEPDWSRLPATYCMSAEAAEVDYNPICRAVPKSALRFERGDIRHFDLRANPVKRLAETGKRIGLLTPEEQTGWLERKAAKSGFEVVDVMIVRSDDPAYLSKGKKAGGRLSLFSVDFKGHLRVLDPEVFVEKAIRSGIGPGKSLGMGMLI